MQTDNQEVSVQTKLGRVMILKRQNPIPPGYHQLTLDECYWIKNQLSQILNETLYNQAIALSSGSIRQSYDGLQMTEQSNNYALEYFAVLLPNDFCANIKNYDQISQLLKKHEFIFLPIGLVLKVPLQNEAPEGFRKMVIQEGYEYKEQLKKLLQTWSIVAFETGKLDGSGYGYKVHDSYGWECGEMFIVSVAPI